MTAPDGKDTIMKRTVVIFLFALLLVPSLDSVAKGRSGLILNAEGLREMFTSFGANYDLYDVPLGEDRSRIDDFYLYGGQNRYTLTLEGEAGRTVTLFARADFGREGGFLVIRKTDDRLVWIRDLMEFPANRWHTVKGENGYGGFEVFYFPAPRFDQNIASVKWGHWWTGDTPPS